MMLPIGTFTLYHAFENCPHKAYHLYVAKTVPWVDTPEKVWGNYVHKGMEMRLRNGVELAEDLRAAEPFAATLVGLGVEIETELYIGMTEKGEHCTPRDDRVWFRGKIDVPIIQPPGAWLIDWKTGKPREEPFELETHALLLKCMHPELENIVGNFYWFQTGKPGLRYSLNYHARTFAKLQALRTEMEGYANSGHWPKRKNPLCGWCDVMSCEHNTSAKRKS